MTIIPDSKDWTWVLAESCPECGFDASDVDVTRAGQQALEMVPRWRAALARPDAAARPDPSTWSVLEYACHVRDVFLLFTERLRLIREQDAPEFANWDQDATAVQTGYAQQRPSDVAVELGPAAEAFAAEVAAVQDWERPGLRSNGSAFTADSLTRYGLHDLVHHMVDVDA
ncbi:DinB family protein [Aeromicrobium duanguangcaii]|uniref:DinB family protein n=1 Tax=Aeromicrobium duanguangcaii TaxID=2968086 RepID=A0ABY5KI55_9ACTN|nr:DinB family protein [Aeromicrobium duanguangcaii]MCD9153776.1 DinB family protein [Aeromicrobium duanguangcaii]UUI69146.1 DinB family protein [Aeromicrobium duanguangcaii]